VWVIIILLFPILGSIVYFVVGRPLTTAATVGRPRRRSGIPAPPRPAGPPRRRGHAQALGGGPAAPREGTPRPRTQRRRLTPCLPPAAPSFRPKIRPIMNLGS
jgi:hypothetical protein